MMTRKLFAMFLATFVCSCGIVKKRTTYGKTKRITVEASEKDTLNTEEREPVTNLPETPNEKAERVIGTALKYSGVKYKYGGTTDRGMDCSGLLYISFAEHDIPIPRVSHMMAREGEPIKVEEVSKGDLLFFKTRKRAKRINHVGLVVSVDRDDIKFIHSTSSRGVIVSSLSEGFWNRAFVKAARIL